MNGIEYLGTKPIPIPKRNKYKKKDNSEILNVDDFSFHEFLKKFDSKSKYVNKTKTNPK